jgi:hypothetical protein
MPFANRYCARMLIGKIRRISAALMAVVLAVGLSMHGLSGAGINFKSAAAVANDMPMSDGMPSKCNGCAGDEKGVAPGFCCAFCGTVIASPAMAVLSAVPAEILTPPIEQIAIGRADPPDPYPPRRIVS